jgi:hypothetical protein
VAAFAATPFVATSPAGTAGLAAAFALLALLSQEATRRAALLGVLVTLALLTRLPWPAPPALALLLWAIATRPRWSRGALDRRTRWLVAASVVLPAVGLVAWFAVARPALSPMLVYFPSWAPRWIVPVGVVLFSVINAAAEEAIWRGAIMETNSSWAMVVVQAAGFGLWHFRGFPSGWAGALLAGGFAFLMGVLRKRTGGMLVPWLTHACADAVIGAIVVLYV